MHASSWCPLDVLLFFLLDVLDLLYGTHGRGQILYALEAAPLALVGACGPPLWDGDQGSSTFCGRGSPLLLTRLLCQTPPLLAAQNNPHSTSFEAKIPSGALLLVLLVQPVPRGLHQRTLVRPYGSGQR